MAVTIGSGLVSVSGNWDDIRDIAVSKGLALQFDEDGTIITPFAIDGIIVYSSVIYQGTPPDNIDPVQNSAFRQDFNNNFRATANRPIAPAPPPPENPNLVLDRVGKLVYSVDGGPVLSERSYPTKVGH